MATQYRADIDGLRCVAVLPVVLFHAGFARLSGGFVGVDVFFVISGYLITGILVREMDEGGFSLGRFYERRVRRIMPAALAVMLASLAWGLVFLMPPDARKLGESAIATTLSGANIYFYFAVDYFQSASGNLPLLHAWSLGVEEQFYLVLPFVLWACVRYARRRLVVVLASITLLSFAASCGAVAWYPKAAFYQLPFRAWELGIGAVLAVLPAMPRAGRFPAWLAQAAGLAGLALIAGSILLLDESVPFPGLGALPACAGAGLVIASGAAGTFTARLLSLPPVRLVGLISYSLYLWHWPVIVLSRLAVPHAPLGRVEAVLISLLLAWLSWRFIERPFRGERMPRPRLFATVGLGVAAVLALSLTLVATGGLPGRFDATTVRLASFLDYDPAPAYREGRCFVADREAPPVDTSGCIPAPDGRPRVLLMGDSHAAHLWHGLSREAPEINLGQFTAASCRMTLASANATDAKCRTMTRKLYREILEREKFDWVLMAGAWQQRDLPEVARTLEWFRHRQIQVVLIGRGATYQEDVPRLLAVAYLRGEPGLVESYRIGRTEGIDRRLAEIARSAGVPFVPLTVLQCREGAGEGGCTALLPGGVPAKFDRGHLTAQGSRWVARAMLDKGGLRALLDAR